jgi:hypothetical protein
VIVAALDLEETLELMYLVFFFFGMALRRHCRGAEHPTRCRKIQNLAPKAERTQRNNRLRLYRGVKFVAGTLWVATAQRRRLMPGSTKDLAGGWGQKTRGAPIKRSTDRFDKTLTGFEMV